MLVFITHIYHLQCTLVCVLRLFVKKAIVQIWIVAHACGLKFYSDSIYCDLLGYNWRQLVENDDLIMHVAQNLQACICTVKSKQLGDRRL